ncbi:MAG TPA: ISL3 family transposase [Chloroflexia bacterium]|nr:ISL3 family transposase [Chloroflexia bacterium]
MVAATILPLTATEGMIQHLATSDEAIIIEAALTAVTATCPSCGQEATRVQSHYWRTLADLPWQGVAVRLRLRVRRFWCDQPTCPQRIFTEQVPTLAARSARKTARLTTVLTHLAFALGGEGGTRLVAMLGMAASAATLLRLIRRTPVPIPPHPQHIGIDDFALRRGRRDGTIIIDLDTHRPVDVLADRQAATVAAWLRTHPEVTTVARDRAGAYAEGIRQGAPAATQVADRWHVLKNLGDALERVVSQHGVALRAAACTESAEPAESAVAAASGGADQPAGAVPRPDPDPPPTLPTPPCSLGDRRQQERFAAIQALHAAGASVSAIARTLGLTRTTVRRYVRATSAPVRVRQRGLLGPTSPYVAHLRTRWAAGCDNAAQLWQELRALGFPGSAGVVRRFLGPWRTTPWHPGRQARGGGTAGVVPPAEPPTPRDVRWWLLTAPDQRPPAQQAYLARLEADCPPVRLAGELAREFGRVVRERDGGAFDAWLVQAETSGLAAFTSCAKGLRQDYAAVAAALREPYSNGPTEGTVTRLKLVKRQMYGRANLDLLRQRVLYRAS